MTRRVAIIAAIVFVALLLQSTLFAELRFLGVQPELVYLVTIVLAMLEGPNEGALVGFCAGLFQDFMLNQPKGITALTLTLLGYGIGLVRQYVVSPSPLLPAVLVAAGTSAGIAFYQVVAFLLGQWESSMGQAVRVALLTGLYGAILTPIVYPLLRRIVEGSRPKRVVRF